MDFLFTTLFSTLALAAFVNSADVDWSKFKQCDYTEGGKTMKKFAKEFEIRTEVKYTLPLPNKNSTYSIAFESTGYYEIDKNRGATFITKDGNESRFLYDFKTGKAFNIFSQNPYYCSPHKDLYKTACSPFAYFIAEEAGHELVKDRCGMQVKGVGYDESYSGSVRGILADRWQQCLYMANENGSYWFMEYYYAKNQTMVTAGGENSIPLRLNATKLTEINSTRSSKTSNNNQLYDFFFYRDRIADKTVFNPPSGVNCPGWAQVEPKPVPQMPQHFSMATLAVSSKNTSIAMHTRVTYDKRKNVVMFLHDDSETWIYPEEGVKMLGALYTTVHDFNSGLSFNLVRDECFSVKAIDVNSKDVRRNTDGAKNVSLIQAGEFFSLDSLNYTYIGLKSLNDVQVHRWTATRNYSNSGDDRENVDLSFYESVDSKGKLKYIPASIDIYRYDSGMSTLKEKISSTVNFYSEDPIFWKAYDVAPCLSKFSTEEPVFIEFFLEELTPGHARTYPHTVGFHNSLQESLSKMLNVSVLRLTDITSIGHPQNGTIQVFFNLMGWANVENFISTEKTSAEVFRMFNQSTFDQDQNIHLDWMDWKEDFHIKRASVRNVSLAFFPTPSPIPEILPSDAASTDNNAGYSGSAMAVLALAMLAIGAVAGIVAGFMLWKRNTGVPYQIYD